MKEIEPNYENSKNNISLNDSDITSNKDVKIIAKKSNFLFLILFLFLLIVMAGALVFKFYPNIFNLGGPDPEEVANKIDLMRQNLISGDYDEAVRYAEDVLRDKGGNDFDALVFLARSYLQKGSSTFQEEEYANKAIEVADRILEIEPEHPEAYRIKGYAYEIMQNYEQAILFYEKAVDVYNGFALAHSQLGHVYDLMGEKERAFEHYGRALFLDPTLDHALINTAYIYYEDGEFDKARDILNKLLADSDDSATKSRASILLGTMLLSEGKYEAASKELRMTVEYDPKYAAGWATLSSAYLGILNGIPEGEGDQEYIDLVNETADKALDIHRYNTYAFVNKANLKLMYEDCISATRMLSDALGEYVDNDITLGVIEKERARTYIRNAIAQCNT